MALTVRKVVVHNPHMLGLRAATNAAWRNPALEGRPKDLGVEIHTDQGVAVARASDFIGVSLAPNLHPTSFCPVFVDGPVVQAAQQLITGDSIGKKIIRQRMRPSQETPFNFEGLTFKLTPTDAMFHQETKLSAEWPADLSTTWSRQPLVPFDKTLVSPAAGFKNYGQGVFEGAKAFTTAEGNIALFRIRDNARRMAMGAKRLGLMPVPEDIFVDAVIKVVNANRRYIPPMGKGALYIRPLLTGSGPVVGVAPAPENTFEVFVTPVGPYFKGGVSTVPLLVSEEYHRAAQGGVGYCKAIGNYAPGMIPAKAAKALGFAEILYLDANNEIIEEAGAANFGFVDKDGTIRFVDPTGTILDGITSRSVQQIAEDLHMPTSRERIPLRYALSHAAECFCTGTAAVISPIGSITYREEKFTFNNGEVGPVTRILYDRLTGAQEQRYPDTHGWLTILD